MKKNMLRLAGALLLSHQLAQAAPELPPPLSSYFPDIGPNATIISEIHDGASIALVGLLTSDATASVQNILRKKNSIRALYIDSPGGDVPAGMALAELVRQHKLRLVVSGRCLSACANYVFTAALRKDVLPGSLVGIHGTSYSSTVGARTLTVNARDTDKLVAASGDASLGAIIAALNKGEHDFYAKFGISTRYHDAFNRYTEQRAARGATTGGCPAFDFWVLRRKDLENMGVTGMGAVWEPGDKAMAGKAAARLGLGTKAVFLGDAAALAAQCQPAPGFMAKLRALFG